MRHRPGVSAGPGAAAGVSDALCFGGGPGVATQEFLDDEDASKTFNVS